MNRAVHIDGLLTPLLRALLTGLELAGSEVDDVIVGNAVNRGGGAIALGHPSGASSAVLVTRLFADMFGTLGEVTATARYALATLGAAGGMGVATLFERVDADES